MFSLFSLTIFLQSVDEIVYDKLFSVDELPLPRDLGVTGADSGAGHRV